MDSWVSAAVEPGTGSSRLLIAGSKGVLHTWDLIANKVTGPVRSHTGYSGWVVVVGGEVVVLVCVCVCVGGGRGEG
jgi:hypothetical protein